MINKKTIFFFILILLIFIPLISAISCDDTDGGIVPEIHGAIYGIFENHTKYEFLDFCILSNKLNEYYCKDNQDPVFQTIECDYKCQDGACVPSPCRDTDDGINKFEKGITFGKDLITNLDYTYTDFCLFNNQVTEYSCSEGELKINFLMCPYGCKNGACSGLDCEDFDLGINSETFGTIHHACGRQKDVCLNSTHLKEFYCNISIGFPYYNNEIIFCPNGCLDRACLSTSPKDCRETDFGIDIFNQGETYMNDKLYFTERCFGNLVEESYCTDEGSFHEKYIACPADYHCLYGKCIEDSLSFCQDTDNTMNNGFNFYLKGTVYGQYLDGTSFSFTDHCISDTIISEGMCSQGLPQNNIFNCPSGDNCVDGVCI